MAGTAKQLGMFGLDKDVPIISGTFAQVRFVLETNPDLRGHVGAVVAKVWDEFHGLGQLIENGQVEVVLDIIGGKRKGVPNYKTVSRNYHRVCKKFPDLYKEPPEDAGNARS